VTSGRKKPAAQANGKSRADEEPKSGGDRSYPEEQHQWHMKIPKKRASGNTIEQGYAQPKRGSRLMEKITNKTHTTQDMFGQIC
jgi:hypothetical protein